MTSILTSTLRSITLPQLIFLNPCFYPHVTPTNWAFISKYSARSQYTHGCRNVTISALAYLINYLDCQRSGRVMGGPTFFKVGDLFYKICPSTQIRKRQICLTLGFIWSKIRGNSAATFIKQKNHKIDWILRFWGICLCKWRFTQNSLHKKTVWHSKFLEKMNLHKETPKDGKIQSILRLFCFTKLTAKFPV